MRVQAERGSIWPVSQDGAGETTHSGLSARCSPGFFISTLSRDICAATTATARGIVSGMATSNRLQELGRAFLDFLVARHGYHGAAAVLMLLAAEMRTAGQGAPPARSPPTN
jgi:hypothetical protein